LTDIPSAEFIVSRYRAFRRDLSRVAAVARLDADRLTYLDYCFVISEWLRAN